jgi:hypothetical protein
MIRVARAYDRSCCHRWMRSCGRWRHGGVRNCRQRQPRHRSLVANRSNTWLLAAYDSAALPVTRQASHPLTPPRDVIAYVAQHHRHGVLTVPFALIHHGSKPYAYEIKVTVNGATDPGMPRRALA